MTRILLIIGILVPLGSCVSPRNWSTADHQETMGMCQFMCDAQGVKRYSPLHGTCECHQSTED